MQKVPRLYEKFHPDSYNLQIDLSKADKRIFHGSVELTGTSAVHDIISLHAKDLDIDNVWINSESIEADIVAKEDTISFKSEQITPGAKLKITINFHGIITDAMHGLYPCYYEYNDQKQELYATQLESHHARELFPCIDEPEAKATFNIRLKTAPGVIALSNMPSLASVEQEDGFVEHIFDATPRMSPYLLAFVVGQFQSKTATTNNGTKVSVYATHAQSAESLDFGLQTAVKSIEFFNDYFGVPYPLPKCDHVALPDFSSGAMENWGLITYREICLLADKNTSISTKEYVATVIAHETSHQWFGNLVTMKWWDDLWLNESFATLMEYMAVDAIYPKWNIWMTFATQESLSALRRDYLAGVQAVKTDVNHPDEISSLFDPSIVYAKGARLLKMLHAYIGEEAFRTGLRQYFRDHAYENTRGDDLWAAFSKATGLDIGSFMQAWLEQPGLPVVSISSSEEGYRLSQQRFVVGEPDTTDLLWPIPLGASAGEFPQLMDSKETTVYTKTNETLYLNKGNSAHFVTSYDETLYQDITAAIRSGKLDEVDRLAILHETSLLARAGSSDAAELYKLIGAYSHEREEPVWDIISMVIADLKRFVEEDDEMENRLKAYVASLALPLYEVLGWDEKDGESESDVKLRATILGLLSYSDYQAVIDEGISRFRDTTDLASLDGELRVTIFAIAAKHGNDTDRERLLALYKDSNVAEIQQDALSGLTTTKDMPTLEKLVGLITDETVVRAQDVDRWFIYLIRNRYSRKYAWDWMVSHWQWITDKFESDKSYDSFPRFAASALSTYAWKETYDAFFAQHKEQPALTRAIELGSRDIAGRAAWIERDMPKLRKELLAKS